MGAETTGATGAGSRLSLWLLRAAPVIAAAALIVLIAGPLGWRSGLLHYRTAFFWLMPAAFYAGLAACAAAVAGLAFGLQQLNRRRIARAAAAVAIGMAAAYFPWHAQQMRGKYPPIHDITTDPQDPPKLIAVLPLRAAEGAAPADYPGAATAALQAKFYPGIEPLLTSVPPAQEFERALVTARRMGWTIVASDAAAGHIEAYDRSFWFGFTDDVAIRVAAEEGGGRVDVRSVSRQGRGDFGVNARRVRAYLAALRAAGTS